MTEKRFKEIISIETVIDNITGKEYKCLLDDDLLDLINELAEENKQLKSKKRTKFIHQHIIRITYPYQTDVEDTEHMIKKIQSIIMNEAGIEPTIEEYLL